MVDGASSPPLCGDPISRTNKANGTNVSSSSLFPIRLYVGTRRTHYAIPSESVLSGWSEYSASVRPSYDKF